MLDKLETIREEGYQRIAAASDMESLEAIRRELTGKKSALQEVLKSLGGLDPEMRKSVGMKANEVKNMFAERLQARQEELLEYLFKEFKDTSGLKKLFIDLSPFSKGKEG